MIHTCHTVSKNKNNNNHNNDHLNYHKGSNRFALLLVSLFVRTLTGWSAMAERGDAGGGTGSARRRRERRFRSFLRHERMSVAMALAESTHHSAQRQKTPRAVRGVRVELHGDDPEQLPPSPQAAGAQHFFLDLDEAPAAGGSRPDRLTEVRPQERVQRYTVEQIILAPMLDVPVPLTEEQLLVDVFAPHDINFFEQVIEVPKILIDELSVRTPVREPQLAEQLVEVPSIISCSSLQRMEQIVNIPVPRGGVRQCFPSSKSLTFQFLMVNVFKVSTQDRVLRHLLNFQLVSQMTRLKGFFALFPGSKSATRPPHSGSALPPHSSPWTPAACAVPTGREEEKAKRRQETQQQASEALERARLLMDQASKRRKRKKRRKRRLPKSSSHSSHRLARSRHMQWHVPVCFSSSLFARPEMLCIMAGMDQEENPCWLRSSSTQAVASVWLVLLVLHLALYSFLPSGQDARHLGRYGTEGQLCCLFEAALVVFFGSGMYLAGFAGDDFSRCVPFCGRHAHDARRLVRQWHVQGWFACYVAPRVVFP